MRLIRIRKLIPLALGLVFPVAIYAQGWIKYVNEGDQFIVNFPAEPQLLEVDYTTESGAIIPSRLYSVENDNGRYAITVVDYTVAEQAHVARCRRMETELDIVSPNECGGRDHLSDIRGAIAFESWNIRRRSNGERRSTTRRRSRRASRRALWGIMQQPRTGECFVLGFI